MKKNPRSLRRLSRPFRHSLAYLCIVILVKILGSLPLTWSQSLGRLTGLLCSFMLTKPNQVVIQQIQATLCWHHQSQQDQSQTKHNTGDFTSNPNSMSKATESPLSYLPTQDAQCLSRKHWEDLGQRLFEWLSAKKALCLFGINLEQQKYLKNIQSQAQQGRAQVILSAHFGHWELMASFLSQQGFTYLAVASTPPKGPMGAWLRQYRHKLGVEIVHPKGGARKIKEALLTGQVVALLIDHSTYERSTYADFLGKKAPLSLTADRLITRFNAEVHWLSNYRNQQGHYQLLIQKLSITSKSVNTQVNEQINEHKKNVVNPNLSSLNKQKKEPSSYVLLAHQLLEQQIRKWPQQWLWLHQKWTARHDHQI